MKKVSLVTVCYNAEEYIEQTIQSVITQNYHLLEYIIIDGGSSDNTYKIIEKYSEHITQFISEPDEGMYHALKKGFSHATGEIFGWVNSDDILLPGALLSINSFFDQFPDASWMTGLPVLMSENGKLFPRVGNHALRLYTQAEYLAGPVYCIQQESTFFKRELYESVGGVSTKYNLAGDYELWCKFFKKSELHVVDTLIGAFRSHHNQLSQDKELYLNEVNSIRNVYDDKRSVRKYRMYRLLELFLKFIPNFLYRKLLSSRTTMKYCYDKSTNVYKREK